VQSGNTILNEAAQYSFRTKTGTCTITSEQIILSREGISGAAGRHIHGNNIHRSLAIYSLLVLFAAATAVWMLANGSYAFGGFIGIVGLFLLWNVLSSRNNSAAPIIERAAVKSVEARAPRPPLTRGYFVVRFVENGKERKRLIMLPGSLSGGKKEYERALLAMQNSGLVTGTGGETIEPPG
jgi:hypothetical protein